jgi:uncharacterized protein YdhG (YjbR/CyaY superfamily)
VTADTVDEYLAGLGPQGAERVEELRRRVRAIRPEVTEVMRYDIPTFQVDGRSRVHVAAWARHASIYPVPDTSGDPELTEALAPYVAGKGTLKFSYSEPLPWPLVDRVLELLLT